MLGKTHWTPEARRQEICRPARPEHPQEPGLVLPDGSRGPLPRARRSGHRDHSLCLESANRAHLLLLGFRLVVPTPAPPGAPVPGTSHLPLGPGSCSQHIWRPACGPHQCPRTAVTRAPGRSSQQTPGWATHAPSAPGLGSRPGSRSSPSGTFQPDKGCLGYLFPPPGPCKN